MVQVKYPSAIRGILHTGAAGVTEKWKRTRQSRSPMSEAVSTHKVCVQDLAVLLLQGIKPSGVPQLKKTCLLESIWQFGAAIVFLWSVTFNVITHCFHPDRQLWHRPTGVQFAQRLVGSNNWVLTEMGMFLSTLSWECCQSDAVGMSAVCVLVNVCLLV